ncbi:MAG: coproporphyrinogen III oxidase, partial [Flavobacteriales bacterium]|nr:coproporphyrinogen III oxidase [Flavobacteriales bacterium]
MAISREEITDWFRELQSNIITALEEQDGSGKFIRDEWERPGGGGGLTCVIENAAVLEKGGVNFSAVHGPLPERISSALQVPPSDFYATGVSIVMHPHNPFVPIIHMNVRYFELSSGLW